VTPGKTAISLPLPVPSCPRIFVLFIYKTNAY
jgi:hypothetical protein